MPQAVDSSKYNDTSVDPKQQYISRLSKTRMYKTVWQTKEETSARLHSPKSTHVNPEHVVAVQQHMHKAEVAVQQQIYYETRTEELHTAC